jgi:hypothetical protein
MDRSSVVVGIPLQGSRARPAPLDDLTPPGENIDSLLCVDWTQIKQKV